MPPAQQQPQPFDPTQITNAISSLKDDLVKEMDSRFAAYEEKLGKVDTVEQILTDAQKAQQEELQRRQAAAQQQQQYQPKSYEQIRQDAANDAYERIKKEQDAERLKQQRRVERETEEERELDIQLQKDIDSLRKSGYLPPVGNSHDPSDPGKFAEDELISRAAALETPAIDQVALELAARHRNNEYWDIKTQSYRPADNMLVPLPGKVAPVGNSSMNAPSNTFQGPSARELRTMTLSQLAQLAPQRGFGPVPTTASQDVPF